jgi:hypothetical protein
MPAIESAQRLVDTGAASAAPVASASFNRWANDLEKFVNAECLFNWTAANRLGIKPAHSVLE